MFRRKGFFSKIRTNFEFLAKTGLVSDLFLKGFLYILRFSEITSRREKSQDKRIRKPKVEKGKVSKLKRKEKKENKEMRFHRKY